MTEKFNFQNSKSENTGNEQKEKLRLAVENFDHLAEKILAGKVLPSSVLTNLKDLGDFLCRLCDAAQADELLSGLKKISDNSFSASEAITAISLSKNSNAIKLLFFNALNKIPLLIEADYSDAVITGFFQQAFLKSSVSTTEQEKFLKRLNDSLFVQGKVKQLADFIHASDGNLYPMLHKYDGFFSLIEQYDAIVDGLDEKILNSPNFENVKLSHYEVEAKQKVISLIMMSLNKTVSHEEAREVLNIVPYHFFDFSVRHLLMQRCAEIILDRIGGQTYDDIFRQFMEEYREFPELYLSMIDRSQSGGLISQSLHYQIYTQHQNDNHLAQFLAEMTVGDFHEKKFPEIRMDLFDKYLSYRPEKIIKGLKYFSTEFDSLTLEQQQDIVSRGIKNDWCLGTPLTSPVFYEWLNALSGYEIHLQTLKNEVINQGQYFLLFSPEIREQLSLTKIQFIKILMEDGGERATLAFFQFWLKNSEDPVIIKYLRQFMAGPKGRDLYLAFIEEADYEDYLRVFDERTAEQIQKIKQRFPYAFSHTDQDKVSDFISDVVREHPEFDFSDQATQDLYEYMEAFGLHPSVILYDYFVNLLKLKRGEITQLPEDQVQSGFDSPQKMKEYLQKIKKQVINGDITESSILTPLDYDVMAMETLFYSGRWSHLNKKSLMETHQKFIERQRTGEIAPLPEGYREATINVSKVEKNIDALQFCSADFFRYRDDLLEAEVINQENGISLLKEKIKQAIESELNSLAQVTLPIEYEKAQAFKQSREKKKMCLQLFLEALKQFNAPGIIVKLLIDLENDLGIKKENSFTTPFIRQILLARVMANHSGYDRLPNDLKAGNITEQGVAFLYDICENVLKQHMLDRERQEFSNYFSADEWQPSKADFIKMRKIFPLHKIKQALVLIEGGVSNQSQSVEMIPDRGFIGELSGYYSEACYTQVEEMLYRWPNLIPYKFVKLPVDSEQKELIGGVLFIESQAENGEKVLIVRAINPRDEYLSDLQAESFCEQVFDVADQMAKRRSLTKVLVATLPGTISNREKINNYITAKYGNWSQVLPLQQSLVFNGLEIQDNCAVVRDVK